MCVFCILHLCRRWCWCERGGRARPISSDYRNTPAAALAVRQPLIDDNKVTDTHAHSECVRERIFLVIHGLLMVVALLFSLRCFLSIQTFAALPQLRLLGGCGAALHIYSLTDFYFVFDVKSAKAKVSLILHPPPSSL